MRYASSVIKAISLILIGILFTLFLMYASGFGEDGNLADLAMSNILISAMILVLIISGLASLAFDFYEKNKYQNEEIFSSLNEKIEKLEELEPKINKTIEETKAKTEQLINDFSEKLEQNSVKTEKFMTQFANLSVQIFAKDKQTQNMEHTQDFEPVKQENKNLDYFSHYTKTPKADDQDIEILKTEEKIDISVPVDKEDKPVDEILNEFAPESKPDNENPQDKLSTIFNEELADTLADLEIMQDDEAPQSEDIDLNTYFTDTQKIKL